MLLFGACWLPARLLQYVKSEDVLASAPDVLCLTCLREGPECKLRSEGGRSMVVLLPAYVASLCRLSMHFCLSYCNIQRHALSGLEALICLRNNPRNHTAGPVLMLAGISMSFTSQLGQRANWKRPAARKQSRSTRTWYAA